MEPSKSPSNVPEMEKIIYSALKKAGFEFDAAKCELEMMELPFFDDIDLIAVDTKSDIHQFISNGQKFWLLNGREADILAAIKDLGGLKLNEENVIEYLRFHNAMTWNEEDFMDIAEDVLDLDDNDEYSDLFKPLCFKERGENESYILTATVLDDDKIRDAVITVNRDGSVKML